MAARGPSLEAPGGSCSPVAVRGLLVAAAPLRHRGSRAALWLWLAGSGPVGFSSCSPGARELRLAALVALRRVEPSGPGIEPVSPHWRADSYPLRHQRSPLIIVFDGI